MISNKLYYTFEGYNKLNNFQNIHQFFYYFCFEIAFKCCFSFFKEKHEDLYNQYESENCTKKSRINFEDCEFIYLDELQNSTNNNIIDYLSYNFYPTGLIDDQFVKIISGNSKI